jgi:hypothetical protein
MKNKCEMETQKSAIFLLLFLKTGVGTLKVWTEDISRMQTLLWLLSGDQGNLWLNAKVDITAPREFWVR